MEVGLRIARTLAFLHAREIYHRDLNAGNVGLHPERGAVLFDFGLSVYRGTHVEKTIRKAGTAGLSAPEQLLGQPTDHRVDIFSFGALLYELMAGRAPWERPAPGIDIREPEPNQRYYRQSIAPLPADPTRPEWVEPLVVTCLAREPSHRPPSVAAILLLLEGWALAREQRMRASEAAGAWRAALVELRAAAERGERAAQQTAAARLQTREAAEVCRAALADVRAAAGRAEAHQTVTAAANLRQGASFAEGTAYRPALIWTPAGSFRMGSPEGVGDDDERPQHLVTLTRPLLVAETPVTQAQYEALVPTNPSHYKGDAMRPVEQVSWLEAVAYCNALTAKEPGLTAAYAVKGDAVEWTAGATGYRLPTEAEWEHVCRAGTTTRWSFGDDEGKLGEYAWYDAISGKTTHRWGRSSRTRGTCGTCTGTCWSGAGTGRPRTRGRPRPTRGVHRAG